MKKFFFTILMVITSLCWGEDYYTVEDLYLDCKSPSAFEKARCMRFIDGYTSGFIVSNFFYSLITRISPNPTNDETPDIKLDLGKLRTQNLEYIGKLYVAWVDDKMKNMTNLQKAKFKHISSTGPLTGFLIDQDAILDKNPKTKTKTKEMLEFFNYPSK